MVADNIDDASLTDEDENAQPTDEAKRPVPQQDDQLQKAIQVLKTRETKS